MLKKSGIFWVLAAAAALAPAILPARAAAPAPVASRASGDQISVYPASFFADSRPATASDMVARLPGFTLNTGQTTVRGFAGSGGNVLVDGARPTAKNDDLDSILDRIPASAVERIEVIRGGAPGIDMQGQSVVANIIRRDGHGDQLIINAETLFLGTGSWNPGGSIEYHGQAGAVRYEATLGRVSQVWDDGPGNGYRLFIPAGGAARRDHAQSWGIMRRGYNAHGAVIAPLLGGEWNNNVTLQTTDYPSGIAYDGAAGVFNFPSITKERTGEFGSHWQGLLDGFNVEMLLLQRLGHREDTSSSDTPADDSIFMARRNTGESIFRGTMRYTLSPDLSLEGGGEGAFNYLDGHTSYAVNGAAVAVPNANVRVDEKRGEVFATATWKILQTLSLEAGSRFEFSTIHESGDTDSTRSFFYPKPRALLSWSPDDRTQLRLRAERTVGQLNFSDFVASSNLSAYGVAAGGAQLRPDQRWQFELAAERHFWDRGALVVSLLHEDITDLQDYIPVGGGLDAPGNIPHATSEQLTVTGTIPLDFLGIRNGLLKPNVYWTDSSLIDPVTGERRRISNQRNINSYYNFTQDIDAWKSTWGISWGTAFSRTTWRISEVRRIAVHNNPLFSIFWSYKPSNAWKITLGADNAVPWRLGIDQYDYPGPRDQGGAPDTQLVRLRTVPRFYLQVRSVF
jgi:outer membrane receptor protein involved in Fe transport